MLAEYRNQYVAIKTLDSKVYQHISSNDLLIRSYLRHPNLIIYLGFYKDSSNHMNIVEEYCKGGSLDKLLSDLNINLSLEFRINVLLDIASAMDYLHSLENPLINANLKSSNVLLSNRVVSDGLAKAYITDYCLSKSFCDEGVRWTAPELLNDKSQQSTKSEVYSFAIIMWEMFTRKRPFYNLTHDKVIEAIYRKERPGLLEIEMLVARELPELIELIKKCWCENANDRPTFADIIGTLRESMRKLKL
jgi:serine/threonine protein kinase